MTATTESFVTGVYGVYERLALFARGAQLPSPIATTEDVTGIPVRTAQLTTQTITHLAAGDRAAAFASAVEALERFYEYGGYDDDFPTYWSLLLDVALSAQELDSADHWLRVVADAPRGQLTHVLRALVPYFRARLGAASGVDAALIDADFASGTASLAAFGAPYWHARCLLDHGEWLTDQGRTPEATAFVDEAERLFTKLRATPWVDRTRKARALTLR
jgi:hypothetical protein